MREERKRRWSDVEETPLYNPLSFFTLSCNIYSLVHCIKLIPPVTDL